MNASRRPLVAGNWKMYKTSTEARAFAARLREQLGTTEDREIALFPPFTALPAVSAELAGTAIHFGGQNCHWEPEGAFTGEVAPGFLVELGCRYVLVGHSERRTLFGEADAACARKVRAALNAGLAPVLCCGETLGQRDEGRTFEVIEGQLTAGLSGLSDNDSFVLAYEPVWAIGTSRNATPEQVGAVHERIRLWLEQKLGPAVAARTRVLYGGSVKPDNIDGLMSVPDVDGALVGGASLDLAAFCRIAKYKQ